MRDILGREVPEGALVIGMTIGRGSDGMRFGIAQGESYVWKHWGLTKSRVFNVYLVENPSEQELRIKQEILDEIHKKELANEQKKQQRKALKRIPTKQLVIGGHYTDDKGRDWCYLGKATVKVTVKDGYDRIVVNPQEKYGYCYVNRWALPNISYVEVLRCPKKLVSTWKPRETERVDLNNLVGIQERRSWGNDGVKQITEVTYD